MEQYNDINGEYSLPEEAALAKASSVIEGPANSNQQTTSEGGTGVKIDTTYSDEQTIHKETNPGASDGTVKESDSNSPRINSREPQTLLESRNNGVPPEPAQDTKRGDEPMDVQSNTDVGKQTLDVESMETDKPPSSAGDATTGEKHGIPVLVTCNVSLYL